MPSFFAQPELRAPKNATVILIHGAIVDPGQAVEMTLLRVRLLRLGYHVVQFRWSSLLRHFDDNKKRLAAFIHATPGETLHVVGHSMGGVLTREIFEQQPDPRPGRLIAIGSPFLGCWLGERVRKLPGGRLWIGRTMGDFIQRQPGQVWLGKREFGVLAGTFPLGVGSNFTSMPRPHDGVVLWKETRLTGVTDHATFRLNHFGMLVAWSSFSEIAFFLAHGKFTTERSSERIMPEHAHA